MSSQRYKLSIGDGAYGPGDVGEIIVVEERSIAGPQLSNWQTEYMLVRCLTPTSYYGEELRYLVLSPCHAGVSLADIRLGGEVVAMGRILPEFWDVSSQQFEAHQVEYWAVGVLSLPEV
jgi:hypothetical protein